jgi:hypothetical protein
MSEGDNVLSNGNESQEHTTAAQGDAGEPGVRQGRLRHSEMEGSLHLMADDNTFALS